ncbi:helix-turn-helix transcriptional regulator [Salinispora mooreana]|uniref:helix-turn-helix transcriptional regulator n=1 Tax=Salinispora mooreana TaxID=999545 RepID=UPI0004755A41|nr:helix-turn-helix transcriptional regulator [Salinispora mooreana]
MFSAVHRCPDAAVSAARGFGDLVADPAWRRPVLLAEDLLLLVTAGRGSAEVDFHPFPCHPGTLLRVRAGQVLRCGPPHLGAIVVHWASAALHGFDIDLEAAPTWLELTGADGAAISAGLRQLAVDCELHRGETTALLRHQLATLLLRLALLAGSSRGPQPASRSAARTAAGTFLLLCRELEQGYQRSRRVEDYADQLGCSVRTLTRACLAVTGRSAKQVVDERVALQARRLLAATDEPVAQVGQRLGFAEPTNFGRFFTREVGVSPGAFRAAREHLADYSAPTGPVATDSVTATPVAAGPESVPALPAREVPPLVRPRPPADAGGGQLRMPGHSDDHVTAESTVLGVAHGGAAPQQPGERPLHVD